MNAIGKRLYELNFGSPKIASPDLIETLLKKAAETSDAKAFTIRFLVAEWEQVVDAWQLESWEAYRDVLRLGRKTRLPEHQRRLLWTVFEKVRTELKR